MTGQWSAIAYPLFGDEAAQDAYVEMKRHEFEQQMLEAYAQNQFCPPPILWVTDRFGGARAVVVYNGCANELPL